MARIKFKPKANKICAFCNNWIGNADLKYLPHAYCYELETGAVGNCTKRHGPNKRADSFCSSDYEPSMEARRLL
jgi:hypothetical protein